MRVPDGFMKIEGEMWKENGLLGKMSIVISGLVTRGASSILSGGEENKKRLFEIPWEERNKKRRKIDDIIKNILGDSSG